MDTASLSLGRSVVVGHLAAVSVATICFGLVEIGAVLWEEGLRGLGAIVIVTFAAIIFWFVAFVTAMLPVALTYLFARLFRIHSIFYYLFCGAATGAALAPIFVWFDWHDDDSIIFFSVIFADSADVRCDWRLRRRNVLVHSRPICRA